MEDLSNEQKCEHYDECQHIKKLEKKIKNLKVDLEDELDELDDLKKDIKNLRMQNEELYNSLDESNKRERELKYELEESQTKNDSLNDELGMQSQVLEFIQEILSAEEIKSNDTNYKEIDKFEDFVNGEFLDLNTHLLKKYNFSWDGEKGENGIKNKKKHFIDALNQWGATKRKSWLDGKKTIAFIGEFSAGKTSIVNRILSQDNPDAPKLPVSAKVTTAVPTYITGGAGTSYNFISSDGKRKSISENTFKKVSKDILNHVNGVSSLIKYFVMTYTNPNLNNLSILDTPGFSSNDNNDHDRTIEVINECDALFWVMDVNTGNTNNKSIKILKENLNKPLYIVINKVDTKSDSDVEEVKNLIIKTLNKEEITIEGIFEFSTQMSLDNIMDTIKKVKPTIERNTLIPDIETDIKTFIEVFKNAISTCDANYNEISSNIESIKFNLKKGKSCLDGILEDMKSSIESSFTEHFLREDNYEMSKNKGNKFKELIDNAYTFNTETNNKTKELEDYVKKLENEKNIKYDLKESFKQINHCFEQFKELSKKI